MFLNLILVRLLKYSFESIRKAKDSMEKLILLCRRLLQMENMEAI